MPTFLGLLLSLTALLLIIIVLIQRGRGGGLAGALGGGGGQSAFGTKAGDLFTKITVGLAAFWILLCIVSLRALSASSSKFSTASPAGETAPAEPVSGDTTPAKAEKPSGADKPSSEKPDNTAKPTTTAPPAEPSPKTPPAPPAGK